MPEIEFAFLADAADTTPGQKFHVIGGGVSRIGGPGFPLRHPHLALVMSLVVTAAELDREHEITFTLLSPKGREVASAASKLVAHGTADGSDTTITFAVDLWNLTFEEEGRHTFRILVNGSERKRLDLTVTRSKEPITAPLTPPTQRYEA